MELLKTILEEVRQQLVTQVTELTFVDTDRGQLAPESTNPELPCALVDVKKIIFTRTSSADRMANMQFTVTAAAAQPEAPATGQEVDMPAIAERIIAALENFTTGGYSPLCCSGLEKTGADRTKAIYEMTFETAYQTGPDADRRTIPGAEMHIDIRPRT